MENKQRVSFNDVLYLLDRARIVISNANIAVQHLNTAMRRAAVAVHEYGDAVRKRNANT